MLFSSGTSKSAVLTNDHEVLALGSKDLWLNDPLKAKPIYSVAQRFQEKLSQSRQMRHRVMKGSVSRASVTKSLSAKSKVAKFNIGKLNISKSSTVKTNPIKRPPKASPGTSSSRTLWFANERDVINRRHELDSLEDYIPIAKARPKAPACHSILILGKSKKYTRQLSILLKRRSP